MEQIVFTAESKYNMGDKVWYISNNKVQSLEITGIRITVESVDAYEVEYILHYGSWISERKLFNSKKELIESL